MSSMDLLGVDLDQPIEPFVKPADYVPGSRSIEDLLLDLRREGQQIAVVVDEFGGAEGIVSIEDIVEEVVEDIQDEYDADEKPTQWIRKLGERHYLVSARVELDTLSEKLGIDLPEGNYSSLAGFLLEKARDVPTPGTVIEYKKYTLTVVKATPQAVQEVRIRW